MSSYTQRQSTKGAGPETSQVSGLRGPDLQPRVCPQVEQQMIHYVHDGSETLSDSFVLVANASDMDRQSQPVAFAITILPVNDQPPVLTTNTGLQVRAAWVPPLPPLPKRPSTQPPASASELAVVQRWGGPPQSGGVQAKGCSGTAGRWRCVAPWPPGGAVHCVCARGPALKPRLQAPRRPLQSSAWGQPGAGSRCPGIPEGSVFQVWEPLPDPAHVADPAGGV